MQLKVDSCAATVAQLSDRPMAEHVLAVKYRATKDKSQKKEKVVHLLSTVHSNKMANSDKTDKDGNAIKKPTCILQYNSSMGGIDLMDQQLDSLLVLRKCNKWYKKKLFSASCFTVGP